MKLLLQYFQFSGVILLIFTIIFICSCTEPDCSPKTMLPDLNISQINIDSPILGVSTQVEILVESLRNNCLDQLEAGASSTALMVNFRPNTEANWTPYAFQVEGGVTENVTIETPAFSKLMFCGRSLQRVLIDITLNDEGEYQFVAKADFFDEVEESNEDNNEFSLE